LCRHQRERASHPDLDSLDRTVVVEMATSPLEGQLVIVQLGIDAAPKLVYLPRTDEVAARSDGNAAAASSGRATHFGHELTWTGGLTRKGGPHSKMARIRPISHLISVRVTTVQDCLGQQWLELSLFGDKKAIPVKAIFSEITYTE